jgi:hypothetical protein
VDGHRRNGDDKGDNAGEHDDDEPGCAVFGLRRGLGDTHGVDEGVRDEQEELHLTVQRFDVIVAGTGALSCWL